MFKKAIVSCAALLLSAACAGPGPAGDAPDYPNDEIRLIVPYAAGGPTDIAGRAVARFLERDLGQPVVVENLLGASATTGTTELVQSKPDGYTIEMATTSPLVLVPQLQNLGYDKDSVATIGVSMQIASVLAVRADSPYRTAEEFFVAARQNPDRITVSLPGANTPQGIELRRLRDEHGVALSLVPFNGDAEAVATLLGGNSDAFFGSSGDVVMSRIRSGEFRALTVGSAQRLPYLPDTPTFTELGFAGLTLSTSTYGLVAPDGTPPEITKRLEEALRAALEDPAVREQIGAEYIPAQFIGAQDFRSLLDESWAIYEPILRR
ncbi:tripartite tricarboxylate transporter substrate binding protein [Saccharopolyspora elongata]|uniref:Tripartite tricarboxylate transporter substrate binding protein n=1 Tax=Saccharopolyspora elongata TaxID=2530387 RepID=A0A4R4Y3H0_9PSEU|nr:tripartite tricarboxylate transporter substrate binding protein [Saccharopolyspora elongata]TDD38765.1 tripartite tricarboxylate transporter substrate binding protein [Saccharopolyspora elongata]